MNEYLISKKEKDRAVRVMNIKSRKDAEIICKNLGISTDNIYWKELDVENIGPYPDTRGYWGFAPGNVVRIEKTYAGSAAEHMIGQHCIVLGSLATLQFPYDDDYFASNIDFHQYCILCINGDSIAWIGDHDLKLISEGSPALIERWYRKYRHGEDEICLIDEIKSIEHEVIV